MVVSQHQPAETKTEIVHLCSVSSALSRNQVDDSANAETSQYSTPQILRHFASHRITIERITTKNELIKLAPLSGTQVLLCLRVPIFNCICDHFTLHNLTSPWPFYMWGIDVITPIEPKASNEHRFILVAIDYFTKWVEAASYSVITRSAMVKFIKKDIICRYGNPAHIIMDNGTNLNNKMLTKLCEQF
ncbi:Pol polyprotein, partial [Mucuna pruriens]